MSKVAYSISNIVAHPSHSAAILHSENCDVVINRSNLFIIQRINNNSNLRILITLYIHKQSIEDTSVIYPVTIASYRYITNKLSFFCFSYFKFMQGYS